MPLTSNVSGGLYALTVLLPVAAGRVQALRERLESLDQNESPFAALPRTHYARFVILEQIIHEPRGRRAQPLGGPFLLLSVTLDAPLDGYLDELCRQPLGAIWEACDRCPRPAGGPALKAYLLRHQIETGLFFAAYPDASVEQVRRSLDLRDRAIAFASRTQGCDAEDLQCAFLEEFGSS